MRRKIIRLADRIVNGIVAIFCLLLLLYGGYALWDTAQINQKADAGLYETYKPESDDALSFAELQKVNPEVFGWLTVEGTHIDYPLVQGENNSKYVNMDVKGKFSLSGSIFLDARNHRDFSDVNNIIYGHHMEKEAMFGEVEKFQEESYFKGHTKGKLYDGEDWHEITFFAFVHGDAYDQMLYGTDFREEERSAYLEYLRERAMIFNELSFDPTDHYVALSTCTDSSTNGRHLLIGRIEHTER